MMAGKKVTCRQIKDLSLEHMVRAIDFLAYRSFIASFNRSLSATKILISLSEDKSYCGFECLAEAKCVSFDIAGNPDSNGFFLCELLNTDILS